MTFSGRSETGRPRLRRAAVILFWISLWQAAAVLIGNSIIFVGPLDVVRALFLQLPTEEFWLSLSFSVLRITAGFLLAFFLAAIAGTASFFLPVLKEFLAPAVLLMKSIPVASFVILALIWIGSENLSVFISWYDVVIDQ